jgi:hypothetical protein
VKKKSRKQSGSPKILAVSDLFHLDSHQRLGLVEAGEVSKRRAFLKKMLGGAALLAFPTIGSGMITGPSGAASAKDVPGQTLCCACDADAQCKCQTHVPCTCQSDSPACACDSDIGCKCQAYTGACTAYGSYQPCSCHAYNASVCSTHSTCTCQNQCACQNYNPCACDPQCTCQSNCGCYGQCMCEVQCACQLYGVCTSY